MTFFQYNLKIRIEIKLQGVINKQIFHSKPFKILKKLLEAGATLHSVNATLQSTSATLQSINATLHLGNATLQSTNATLQSGNATLQSTNATLQLGNATLQSINATLHSGSTTLHSVNATLHLSNTRLHSFLVGLFLILSKIRLINTHQVINIKYFICNVKGLHFNLAFINYHKLMV